MQATTFDETQLNYQNVARHSTRDSPIFLETNRSMLFVIGVASEMSIEFNIVNQIKTIIFLLTPFDKQYL